VPSAWIAKRQTRSGTRYRVMFRVGGRESYPRYGGSFERLRDAQARRSWVVGELAAMRVPEVGKLVGPVPVITVREAAERWLESRIDVAENTRANHRSSIEAVLPLIGTMPLD
jgi:hypothetical protein